MQKKRRLISLLDWKETIVTSAVILACLALFFFFPASGGIQSATQAFFCLFIIPVLYIKFVLRSALAEFGLNLRNKKAGLYWGLAMVAVSLIISYILIRFYGFAHNYHIPFAVTQDFWIFIFYEIVLINILFFLQEFFFKGFALFTFSKKLGFWSIILSAIIYIGLFLIGEGLSWQMVPMVIIAISGSIITYKTHSFVYSYLSGLIYLMILDSYIIHILNK